MTTAGTAPPTARGGRHGRGERAMVPEATFGSYYGRPIVKKAPWQAREIAGYFFLGGLAGAASPLAEGARLTGRPALARAAGLSAAAAVSLSFAALVKDLGRPERFLNMLRVAKPTSPMSVGTWLLVGFGPASAAAAASDVTGLAPGVGRLAGRVAAVTGPLVATYTAVLLADTATPAWHAAWPELPFVFAGSAAAAAGGISMLAAPVAEAGPARRMALAGAAVEVATTQVMHRRLGELGSYFTSGRAGRFSSLSAGLTAAGAVLGAVAGRRSRLAAVAGGLALLAGSACGRVAVFEAGQASADDPRATVAPQRARRPSG